MSDIIKTYCDNCGNEIVNKPQVLRIKNADGIFYNSSWDNYVSKNLDFCNLECFEKWLKSDKV